MKWEITYRKLCEELNINCSRDIDSENLLSSFNSNGEVIVSKLMRFRNRNFTIVGPYGNKIDKPNGNVVIVADSAIDRIGITPHVIVTDLDGNMERIIHFCKSGSIPLIHAHGDNINLIKKYVPKFGGIFIATTQVPGERPLMNLEGFTDGDRSVKLANLLEAKSIQLNGFNFIDPVYKKGSTIKAEKLKFAQEIILDVVRERLGTALDFIPHSF